MVLHVQLDVNYADDDKIVAAGEKAELLYVRSLCYAKRLMTDGFVSDSQLPRFLLPGVQQRAKKLLEVGLWQRDDERKGYVISSWLRRNPSAEEIKIVSEAKKAGGKEGNHKRWHRKERVSGCEWCESEGLPPPSGSTDRSSDRTTDRGSESIETKTETETDKTPAAPDPLEGFDAFWEPYPRKVEKAAARSAWKARRKARVPAEEMVQASCNYAKACAVQRTELPFIKHPASFIGTKEPWKDYLEGGEGLATVEPPRPRDVPDHAICINGTWNY